jgi:hypothetical protein
VLFAERVLAMIESDFDTFARGHPLPIVNRYGRVPDRTGTPNYYLGTALPPGSGDNDG